MKFITAILLMFGFILGNPVFADDAFTNTTVRHFIDSLKELEQLSKKYENDPAFNSGGHQSMDQAMQRMQSPFSSMNQAMHGSRAYDEYTALLKRNGFNTPEQWSQTGNRIYRAMAAVQMEKEMPPDMNQQIAQARERLKNSSMSAEQQQMMLNMMSASSQVMQQFQDVPQADRDIVKPYIAEFEQLSKE